MTGGTFAKAERDEKMERRCIGGRQRDSWICTHFKKLLDCFYMAHVAGKTERRPTIAIRSVQVANAFWAIPVGHRSCLDTAPVGGGGVAQGGS